MSGIESFPTKLPAGPVRTKPGVPDAIQQQIKSAVHKELIKRLDLDQLHEFDQTRSGQQRLHALI